MIKLQSLSLLFLCITVFSLSVSCEADRKNEDKFNVAQENNNFNPYSGKSDELMEPNFFRKIGTHIVKGWDGLRGLFGRRSNRREENIYKPGAYGREEPSYQQPSQKESTTTKEYPETNYNNYGNNGESNQGQVQGGQKENQEGQGFGVDERLKGSNHVKGSNEDKNNGFEELSGNYGKIGEEEKKSEGHKPSNPSDGKHRPKRSAPGAYRRPVPYRGSFRVPVKPPSRGGFRRSKRALGPFRRRPAPFRRPFRVPFRQPSRGGFRG